MHYCKKCLMPDTKPYISFDENGICNACNAHVLKNQYLAGINWEKRRELFEKLISDTKEKNAPFYDALIPVSGGKDSVTQVYRLLGHGLRILAVNVDYGIKTEIGHYNLGLIPKMGANLIIYRPEQELHRRLIRIGLEDFGDPDLLSHTLLHAYPLRCALQFNIPLVLLGENSAFEYGGNDEIANKNYITREWFSLYAANKGHDARFVSEKYKIPTENLILYDFPDEIEQSTIKAVFCSFFFHWDSEKHLEIAKQYGFRTLDHPGEGTFRNYVGIDEKINRIHQYLKVLKFGYGRATDHACEDIRNGRLTREEAKKLVKEHDLKNLSDYFIDDFVRYVGYEKQEFLSLLERYRNKDIWKKDENNQWYIPGHLEETA
jgi:N-acetyl sugar amidotransferase